MSDCKASPKNQLLRHGPSALFRARVLDYVIGWIGTGRGSASDYGKIASQTAKAMRQLDPSVELVVCGSSSAQMPTFGSWEHTVLEHTYDDVDFISCHAYYEELDGDTGSFLASAVNMDHFIESVVATADAVGAQRKRKTKKKINISSDEWNV